MNAYVDYAPMPNARQTNEEVEVSPFDDEFSGFIFKIQANMDPKHRDRIAFMRVVSGAFERGMDVTLQRTNKNKNHTLYLFMADDKETVNHAVAGDIIGLYDTGNYQIGDTLVGGKQKFNFQDLPQFTPEIFMKVSAKNVMKQNISIRELNSLCKKVRFNIIKHFIRIKLFSVQWVNYNLKYSSTE